MIATFADSFYFLALLNPRDFAHVRAMQAGPRIAGGLLTTEFVLLEVADALAAPAQRLSFLNLLESLAGESGSRVVPATSELLHKGVELYRRRPDKDWPLTDCISFVVMSENGIVDALTGDSHFRQAGFNPLLLD